MSPSDPSQPRFPSLPIIQGGPPPESPRRSMADRYGGLLYLGVAGLVVLAGLLGWFGYRAWALRDVWRDIYVLNDPREPDPSRVEAAARLAGDPRVEPRQLWDLALNRLLPDRARCVLAEGIGSDLVASDPRGFANAVARSPDWPGWLRLALVRPLALASTDGHTLPRERLGDLCRGDDPILRLWALYTLAVQPRPDPQTAAELDLAASTDRPEHELAAMLLEALRGPRAARLEILDRATRWNHEHHAETRALWQHPAPS
ncbi:hypothetical protein OJF2_62250 [Aquisphaera giovannonii]|uniref:HEAT repeat protein n=1 Tax=Aquisphaera giovannonii TaxID=406548 RepID=A0A5B9WBI8_9BACT|nr:hypothetical protein [Aquisphaera giovannonii]QEH37634.1 hypothetical protein OJF2_62250 [Aquisphaera giovannonii]